MGDKLRFGDVLMVNVADNPSLACIDDVRLLYVRRTRTCLHTMVLIKGSYSGWASKRVGESFTTYKEHWMRDEGWPDARPTTSG